MFCYAAYGLIIQSEVSLPELVQGRGEPDVFVRFGKLRESLDCELSDMGGLRVSNQGIFLYWPDIGLFLVRNGNEIIVDPNAGLKENVLRLFILGTALAILLHQRQGLIVLHASAVEISGKVVAFVGVKHAGKSTTAATLCRYGHRLVADDILAIRLDFNRVIAIPGFPHLKLWPDSVASLGVIPESLPQLRPEVEKRGHRIHSGFQLTPLPLERIFVLDCADKIELTSLGSKEALKELMPHWYGARFDIELLQALGIATHFQQCAMLAKTVQIRLLTRTQSFADLPKVIQLIEEDVLCEAKVAG